MKAQSFFGGTKPKVTGKKATIAKPKTGTSTGGGINIQRKTGVKQVGVTSSPKTNNSQMVRDKTLSTRAAKNRPSLAGKEDNRTNWK